MVRSIDSPEHLINAPTHTVIDVLQKRTNRTNHTFSDPFFI